MSVRYWLWTSSLFIFLGVLVLCIEPYYFQPIPLFAASVWCNFMTEMESEW